MTSNQPLLSHAAPGLTDWDGNVDINDRFAMSYATRSGLSATSFGVFIGVSLFLCLTFCSGRQWVRKGTLYLKK